MSRDAIETRYINIWTAPGLLGSPTRAHSSIVYTSAAAALEGRSVPPDAGFALLATLDLRGCLHEQPRFISPASLAVRAAREYEPA